MSTPLNYLELPMSTFKCPPYSVDITRPLLFYLIFASIHQRPGTSGHPCPPHKSDRPCHQYQQRRARQQHQRSHSSAHIVRRASIGEKTFLGILQLVGGIFDAYVE